jgi:hypothetical protein
MERFSMNSRVLVHVQLEQGKNSSWKAEGNKSRLEQGSAALTPFGEQSVGSHGSGGGARGKPPFVEQEPEQSGSSQAEQGREREEELDVEMQMRSGAEDIARQI